MQLRLNTLLARAAFTHRFLYPLRAKRWSTITIASLRAICFLSFVILTPRINNMKTDSKQSWRLLKTFTRVPRTQISEIITWTVIINALCSTTSRARPVLALNNQVLVHISQVVVYLCRTTIPITTTGKMWSTLTRLTLATSTRQIKYATRALNTSPNRGAKVGHRARMDLCILKRASTARANLIIMQMQESKTEVEEVLAAKVCTYNQCCPSERRTS